MVATKAEETKVEETQEMKEMKPSGGASGPKKPSADAMWQKYQVALQINGPLASGLPKARKEIEGMLEHRQPSKAPVGATPIPELIEEVAQQVGADDEELTGYYTFKRDDTHGFYFEGRALRAHMKDCALQIAAFFPEISNFRAKFVNRVYVVTDKVYLGKKEPDGTEQRFVQVMTRQGPRSAIKHVDYVNDPLLTFEVAQMEDHLLISFAIADPTGQDCFSAYPMKSSDPAAT